MTPERRSEGLAAAARSLRGELIEHAAGIAGGCRCRVVEPPTPGSVMVELESPVGSFCLTEVVVTTARVEVDGAGGWGCVLGFDEEGALAGALLDAAPGSDVQRLAQRALDREAREREAAACAVASTEVGTARPGRPRDEGRDG